VIVDCNTKIPSRTPAYFGEGPSPAPAITESVDGLIAAGADLVVVPCNQAHYWYFEVNRPQWVNMIEVVGGAARIRGFEHPIVVGGKVTVKGTVYGGWYEYANDPLIYKKISHAKAGGDGLIDHWMPELLKRGDGVIIACTELSVSEEWEYLTINSLQVYAKKIARMVMYD
jgi:aspartate/glutamate racemase